MAKEENINIEEQELLYKFSMFEQQIRELQQQIEAIEKGIVDLNSLNLGLDELVGSTGKEIFAPFGKGIFVKAKLISEELNVDIGNGNLVKKSIPETKELIDEQLKKLEGIRKELEENLEQIGKEIEKIMKESHEKSNSHEHKHEHQHEHNHERGKKKD